MSHNLNRRTSSKGGMQYSRDDEYNVWIRSCEKEIIEPIEGVVTGEIPSWIKGSLFRNGPGSIKVGEMSYNHLFDAAALIHRFNIEEGKVTYQCRFLKSEAYKKNLAANRIVVNEFATCVIPDPCQSIFKKVSSIFKQKPFSDNALISIYPFNEEMYALTEFPVIFKFDQETLETNERVDLSQKCLSHSAHPIVMEDGSLYNLGTSFSNFKPFYDVIFFPNSENLFENARVVAKIPSRWNHKLSYMHMFGITENFFVIVEQPYTISLSAVIKTKIFRKPFASCFQWDALKPIVFYLIDRKIGKIAYKFEAKSFCFFHIINQFETDGNLVIDICCFPDAEVVESMYIESLKGLPMESAAKIFMAEPRRFILPLKKSSVAKVREESLCDVLCELPRINDKFNGTDYQFFYALSSEADIGLSLVKVDIFTKNSLIWCETNCYPSEPIFVQSPNSTAEDDGVILASMVWGKAEENRAGLLVLDAKTMKELGRSEFNELPGPVPKCFHGWFAARSEK